MCVEGGGEGEGGWVCRYLCACVETVSSTCTADRTSSHEGVVAGMYLEGGQRVMYRGHPQTEVASRTN